MDCMPVNSLEKLYLSKDIYIENFTSLYRKIPQHVIDNIRFLYRQYMKKKSGIILSYKIGYGANLQIVLFLKAIRCLLKKPVLVLCKEGAEHNWMEQFQTWTDFYDEVALETQKPFIKKRVLINPMVNLPAFSRHEWSFIVVDGDEMSPSVLKLPFKAEFKIYMTSVNMKENLNNFSQIYMWLYPEEGKDKNKWKFNKNEFIPNMDNPRDVVDKAILLDAFMEDIVTWNEEPENSKEDQDMYDYPPIPVSRKNKDATGTKIKRSKRKIYDDDDDDIIMNTLNSQSQLDLYYEPDSMTDVHSDKIYEMDTLVFSDNMCNNQVLNDNKPVDVNNDLDLEQSDETKENSLGPNYEIFNALDTKQNSESDIQNEIPSTNIKNNNESNEQLFFRESPSICDEINPNNDEFNIINDSSSIDILKSNGADIKSNIVVEVSPTICNEINLDDNEIEDSRESLTDVNEIEKSDKGLDTSKDIEMDIINEVERESNHNEIIEDSRAVTNKTVAPISGILKHDCIEDKMKEMEEKALKKFKGSILDSLF